MAMYEAMLDHFGPQDWWPGEGKLEICVGAILTQNTNWANVEKAIANLNAAGAIDVAKLHEMPAEKLSELIRPAGYFRRKAGRLKNFIADVVDHGGRIDAYLQAPVETLRNRLLAVKGVGPETADSIVLYAAGKLAFVVDAYTVRILSRHRLITPGDDYASIQSLFTGALPPKVQLYNEYHALLVCVGKHFCKPTARCAGCPLEPFDHEAG
jgi:endonuclease-3 related protein